MTEITPECTVARYLARRLAELGITHLFGVPGNHLGPFLTTLRAEGDVEWVGTPTEGGAGQAADSYARLHGIGAAAVTYSVGAFNLLNACGGAYVEHVPLIAINACPPYEQWQNYRALGLLTSHMSPRRESNLDAYRQVTVEAQVISNPGLAPGQIDAALTACLSERRPVYLEVMEDLWDEPCAVAEAPLLRRERPFSARNQAMLATAVAAILALVEAHPGPDGRPRPIVWAGEEVERFRLDRQLSDLTQATGVPFCTTVGAKAVLDERLPQFHGVYNGKASHPDVHSVFKDWATCRIGLGTWSTSKNLGGELAVGTDWVVAARGGVSVGTQYFPDVQLARLIPALRDALVARFGSGGLTADYFAEAHAHHGAAGDRPASLEDHRATTLRAGGSSSGSGERLTYDGVFDRINHFLAKETRESWTVVSDAAFSLIGSMNLTLPAGGFLSQVSWLSIGWSVGAATGAALAPERGHARPMVFVGDGAFQETCQEISTHTRLGLRPVVFVMDNGHFYGIEQMLVHPSYYAGRDSHGADDTEGADFYNVLHPWHYERLADVFSGKKTPAHGVSVAHAAELDELLVRLTDPTDPVNSGPLLVRVRLHRHDYPRAMAYKVKGE
ncbi:thiamine pyrophosphate-binding protein [Streptomyces rapamycinicus]|uniref:Alpha-keto-acid decarboxylase n=2 Tax=Streptomyces rapamycinicus TaxID=1226757 RepID=A0A0A0NRQ5_STRRN|nr:thiamine pyrophosphate-binding protein [Streptomyces rapamycinicus]AGP59824.1 decarboxylase [Streptomyces rapamycinicus NRRL 5491]MBB4789018.1 indolepyruvate decarboxylase [Streptomyces rapamycinicus]RLV76989.1 decarboxylase [Streptomyces rapamycinicus NRRL 5491]UTO67504.1 thiamine pyrophosphate-dependent enzyme [Streptomyces rapamycinicus]UTP35458.1 thiamine pyrophosphate-dependent enzyme [Streptomyces rapamycinicus NRRL 5491]